MTAAGEAVVLMGSGAADHIAGMAADAQWHSSNIAVILVLMTGCEIGIIQTMAVSTIRHAIIACRCSGLQTAVRIMADGTVIMHHII